MLNPRIFIVIATFHPIVGGAEKQALAQGRSLRKRGFEATIVTFRHNHYWATHDMIDEVPVIRVAGTLLGKRERFPRILQRLVYLMAVVVMGWKLWQYRDCYDVLHLYQMKLLALPAALACYFSSKPMIVAVRNTEPYKSVETQKEVSLIAGPLNANTPMLRILERVKGGDLQNLEQLGKPIVRFTHFLLQRINVVVIILSSRMKDYLVAHDFTFHDTQLIPNGIDISHFTPIDEDVSHYKQNQIVICTARLCYQKGLDVLIQAWNLVHMELSQAQLLIAGVGPLQPQLEYMVQALGLSNCIKFVGLQKDIPALLHESNLAVLPSRWEGMPNALLEAMSSGLPCVATRVSGSEDIIQHGINGLLVEVEDYHNLAQAILTLLGDPELAQGLGNAARARVVQNYSLDHITDIYIELYRRITDSKRQIKENTGPSKIFRSTLENR